MSSGLVEEVLDDELLEDDLLEVELLDELDELLDDFFSPTVTVTCHFSISEVEP